MADIGNYSFVITADATQGIQVLEQLGQKVQAISNTVSHTLAGPTVTGAFKTLTDGIKSPFNALKEISPALSGIMGPLAGVASIGGLVYAIGSGVEKLALMGRTARQVGLEVGQFSGLVSLAGGDVEEMASQIVKLNRHLGEAQKSFESGAEFRSLGLDPSKMRTTGDAIDQIFVRYNQLNSAADKAVLLEKTFGRQGEEMGRIFAKAGGDLATFHEMVNAHAQDASGVEAAERGAKAWAALGRAVKDTFLGISGWLAKAKESVWDPAANWVTQMVAELAEEFGAGASSDKIMEIVNKNAAASKAAPAGTQDLAASDATEAINKLNHELLTQVDTFGMTSDAVDRYKQLQAGAAQNVVDLNQELNEQLRALNAQKYGWDQINKIIAETASPIEKIADEMLFLNAQFENLGPDAYFKKLGMMAQSLGSLGTTSAPANAFAEAGSREANRITYELQQGQMSTQERMRALLESIDIKQGLTLEQGRVLAQLMAERNRPITASF
jgi:hypothetical protein